MDPAHLYFSLEGRTGRRDWWIGIFPLLVLAVLLPGTFDFVLHRFIGGALPGYKIRVFASLLTISVVLHPVLAIFIKRLHDLPRTGWWAFYLLIPVFIVLVIMAVGIPPYLLLADRTIRIGTEIYLAGALWLIGEMAFRPGLAGDSKYGADPRHPPPSRQNEDAAAGDNANGHGD